MSKHSIFEQIRNRSSKGSGGHLKGQSAEPLGKQNPAALGKYIPTAGEGGGLFAVRQAPVPRRDDELGKNKAKRLAFSKMACKSTYKPPVHKVPSSTTDDFTGESFNSLLLEGVYGYMDQLRHWEISAGYTSRKEFTCDPAIPARFQWKSVKRIKFLDRILNKFADALRGGTVA